MLRTTSPIAPSAGAPRLVNLVSAVASMLAVLVPRAAIAAPAPPLLEAVDVDALPAKGAARPPAIVRTIKRPVPTIEVEEHTRPKKPLDPHIVSKKAETTIELPRALEPKLKPAEVPVVETPDPPKVAVAATPKAGTTKVKLTSKVAARTPPGAHSARKAAPDKPCWGPRVHVDRGGLESESFPLVDCHDRPLASAEEKLSVLVRPWGAARPKIAPTDALPKPNAKGEIAPGVKLIDAGLLTRLEAIAKHFPGKPFSFVSGYRPQSTGSLHQSGRAVDMRVVGVTNEELVAFCKTLKDTGCGYYPNSSFVHVDVRNPKTGSTSWIDASGPGQAPRYVSSWPPPKGAANDEPAPAEGGAHDEVINGGELGRKNLGEYPEF